MANNIDVAIIGGGSAGLGAAVYAGRAKLRTVIFDKFGLGGQLNTYDKIANYPGFPEDTPTYELIERLQKQATRFGAEIVYDEIQEIKEVDVMFHLKGIADTYISKTAIVSTGVHYKALGAPGEERLRGRGVSYCATCDGPFFVGKPIVVVGGGDSALQEADHLTQFGSSVTIIHRRNEFRAYPDLQEKVLGNPKVRTVMETVVESIEGKDFVEKIVLKNVKSGNVSELETSSVFIFVGLEPQTQLLSGLVDMDKAGYVVVDGGMRTSKKGLFSAGDINIKEVRQVITAVSDGAIAAQSAWKYISGH